MALNNTLLQDAIVAIRGGNFGKFENRISTYGALQAFKDNAPRFILPSAIEDIKKSVRTPEKIPVMNKFTTSLITAPSCNPVGGRPSSTYKSITWAFTGFEIKTIPAANEDNYISLVEDIAQQMLMGWKSIFAHLDTLSVDKLETNKSAAVVSSVNPDISSGAGGYDYVGDLNLFFLNMPALLAINDLDVSPLVDVANSESLTTRLDMQTWGQQNNRNLAGLDNGSLKGATPIDHYITNRIDPDGNREVHYLSPEGVYGVYNWVDPDSRARRQAGNKFWDTIRDPYFDFDWSVFTVRDCEDLTNDTELPGMARAYTEVQQIGAWFAFLTDYSSDTSTPIIKVTMNNTSGS